MGAATPQSNQGAVIETLKTDLRRARLEYEATKLTFDRLVAEVPSGIPHPDGSLRIQKAGKAYRVALQNFDLALRRFSEFTLNGSLPDDAPPER